MAKMSNCKLEFVREDDFVEYFLFPLLPEDLIKDVDSDRIRNYLGAVLKQCNDIVNRKIGELNHIWHKDEFRLQIRTGSAEEQLFADDIKTGQGLYMAAVFLTRTIFSPLFHLRRLKEHALPPHLHGVTHYGDNIEDEWLIVRLINDLTREISGLIARVIDSDGEFLLIEAADYLPDWASPDTCEQRVYIVNGVLHLVQNSPSNTTALLPVAKAIMKLHNNAPLYRVSSEIQKSIEARLKDFEKPNNASLYHRHIVRLPLTAAAILKEQPSLIAGAVRAFCERDAIDMKACRSMRFFPPEQHRVRMSVRFTRCLYAMIMSSNYTPDRKIGWNLSNATNTDEYKEDLLGIKIACGLEILASQAKEASGRDENDPAWRSFIRSLTSKGYFRGNLEGSSEYKMLLNDAKSYFEENNAGFRTATLLGSEILALLSRVDINAESLRDEDNNLEPSDSDDWLNITPAQLDELLLERYGPKRLYKGNGDLNAEEFTKNLADFLDKESAFDGIDSDDDSEDATTSTLKDRKNEFKTKIKKNHSMRKACKQNSVFSSSATGTPDVGSLGNKKRSSSNATTSATDEQDQSSTTHVRDFLEFVIPEDNWESNSEMSDYEDEEDLERNIEAMTNTNDMNINLDIQEYMRQMDRELAKTTIGQTFQQKSGSGTKSSKAPTGGDVDDFDDIESFEPININVNTLKNMMDSYKSQIGGTGPVSHLLNAMGVGMSATTATQESETEDLKESQV